MKHLILLLLISLLSYGQKLTDDEQAILNLEVQRNIDKLKQDNTKTDSIVINKKAAQYEIDLDELKTRVVVTNELSADEADEIFSKKKKTKFIPKESVASKWERDYFKEYKVFFFDEEKHNYGYTNSNSNKIGIGHVIIFSFSVPLIRNDGKYALIQTSNEHEGGVLHIYKNTAKGWVLYKNIQLYYI